MSKAAHERHLGYIPDHETKVDLLRNEAIAKTVINLITRSDDRPITIGVHGYWGAGKSSVLEMIAARFPDQGEDTLIIPYNGW
ncbi:P-loop NTPase fold protein [Agrobacterium arsenijevicii]|uniref:P-loop NTPase fold protein n=1 Tax=Agrobacterium arsenijevicii TaxID=1585697 RepID=UPI0008DD09A2